MGEGTVAKKLFPRYPAETNYSWKPDILVPRATWAKESKSTGLEWKVQLDKSNAAAENEIGSEVPLKIICAHAQALVPVSRPLVLRLSLTATAATSKKDSLLYILFSWINRSQRCPMLAILINLCSPFQNWMFNLFTFSSEFRFLWLIKNRSCRVRESGYDINFVLRMIPQLTGLILGVKTCETYHWSKAKNDQDNIKPWNSIEQENNNFKIRGKITGFYTEVNPHTGILCDQVQKTKSFYGSLPWLPFAQ